MTYRIYVGNIPERFDEALLRRIFYQYRKIIDVEIIKNKKTGKNKGYCFISFEDELNAERAIAEMNKRQVAGTELVVKEAYPRRSNWERKVKKFKNKKYKKFSKKSYKNNKSKPYNKRNKNLKKNFN